MGNSEVGHLNLVLGASFAWILCESTGHCGWQLSDPVLTRACGLRRRRIGRCTLSGCFRMGSAFYQRHLYALLKMAAQHKLTRVFFHAFMDGRDTMPTSGLTILKAVAAVSSVWRRQDCVCPGRYYAMDHDSLGEGRQAFDAMVTGHPKADLFRSDRSYSRTLQQWHA